MSNEKILDITWRTILRIALVAISAYFLYLIQDILIWFIFALIISILFKPAVEFLSQKKIPRVLGVILVYFGIFGIFGFLIYRIAPIFASEVQEFSQHLSQYYGQASPLLEKLGVKTFESVESFMQQMHQELAVVSSSIFAAVASIFGGISATAFTFVLAIFLSLEKNLGGKTIGVIVSPRYRDYALDLWARCEKRVTGWFLTRILASLFVGLVSYLGFLVFRIEYPFSLALFSGVFDFIPVIGPLFTAAVIFLIVALSSLWKAIFVLAFVIVVQLIEANIFTPIITKKFMGLRPALVLIALVVGGKLWGILGAFLVIPLAGILFEFFTDFLKKRRKESSASPEPE